MAQRKKRGNTPAEQQGRNALDVDQTPPTRLPVSGPGAADFLTAPGGIDRPGSGGKGMSQLRDDGPLADASRVVPRQGPDTEAFPGERRAEDEMSGSQTGTIGGGGSEAHNPSPNRATGSDDDVNS